MRIAVLSGKGGTGKTLVSVNLAAAAPQALYVDCDVEEPNGHLFFRPEKLESTPVNVLIPQFDWNLCNGCRKCIDFCKFNALAYINDLPFLFPRFATPAAAAHASARKRRSRMSPKALARLSGAPPKGSPC